MSKLISALVALVFVLFSNVAFAQDGSSILTPLYGVGVAEVSASSAASEICSRWQACESSSIDCDITVEAATSHNEHVVRSRGTSFEYVDEAALGYARQANLVQQIQTACPASASDLDIKIGATWPHKKPSLSYRYAWATVRPAVDAAVLADAMADFAPPTACNDGEDNDDDTLIDLKDPGCENSQDDSEFNYNSKMLIHVGAALNWKLRDVADRKCPWQIVAMYDPKSSYVYASIVSTDPSCTCDEVKPFETEKAFTAAVLEAVKPENVPLTYPADIDAARTQYRATVSIFTDEIGASWDEGNFMTYGRVTVTQEHNFCDIEMEQKRLADYTGTDLVVIGAGSLSASVLGDGSSLSTHPAGTLVAEFGIETGTPKAAFLGTIGLGGYFDDNCAMPAAWLMQFRLGGTFNRSEPVGMLVDARVQYSFGPSYVIYPDDPETETNEYSASSALGTNAAAFLVDIGPRFAFGRGVKNGWIAPTLTAGPKLRWFEPTSGDQRVTLTADFGATVNIGFDW